MKAKFLIFLLLIASFFANAQTPLGINTNLSPDGKLDNIFVRFGNQYKLADIIVQPNQTAGAGLIASTPTCTSGMFELYFEAGSGMEGTTPIENQRRAVVCQVFQDVSNFINSPLKNAGNTQKVRIWVRDINNTPNFTPQVLGLASGFFNFPATPTPPINGGIADNEIWKTIHAGVDSYIGVVPPITSNFYHGLMAINFNGINWNLDINANATSAQNDLYCVVLHEVTHALGFASQISASGNSNFAAGYNYFSRYDSKLKDSNNNFLIQQNATTACSNMYNYNFSLSQNILHPTCGLSGGLNPGTSADATFDCNTAIRYQNTTGLTTQVYTPRCFENGSSLSHFEDQCFVNPATSTAYGNNNYFVMSNANAPGTTNKFLKPEERQALCDIGYSLNTVFATGQFNQYVYPSASVCGGNDVAGMNDGLTATNYSFIGNAGTNIAITGLLNNDVSYTYSGGVATNNIANLRFECLQDVYYGTTTAVPTGTLSQITATGNTATATIIFRSLEPGLHLLRYVPFDSVSGQRGNITYVYVLIFPLQSNCNSFAGNNCNMIQNGILNLTTIIHQIMAIKLIELVAGLMLVIGQQIIFMVTQHLHFLMCHVICMVD